MRFNVNIIYLIDVPFESMQLRYSGRFKCRKAPQLRTIFDTSFELGICAGVLDPIVGVYISIIRISY